MRNFTALSDVEFESVCSDLLQEELGNAVEIFARGADGGVDLRWNTKAGLGVGQCKHYTKSTWAHLWTAAKAEVTKVSSLNPQRYLFMTSQSLTAAQKQKIFNLFQGWMQGPEDVWSGEYIDSLLSRHRTVEMRHVKLWLNTGSELYWAVHSGLMNRSAALAERAAKDLHYFVPTDFYTSASNVLNTERVCLIAGPPGAGKTMLAHALLASAMQNGYEPIEISGDVNEGWDALDRTTKQFFIYDDFLGQIALSERLGKKEDQRLVDFITQVSRSQYHRFVLTTREYILRDAEQVYPLLASVERRKRLILSIPAYNRLDKGRILYNHVWHSHLPKEMKKELSRGGWKQIVDHPNYNPRLIQYATGDLLNHPREGYLSSFVAALDHPHELWSNAYDNHLDIMQQSILLVLCSFGGAHLDELSSATASYAGNSFPFTSRRFSQSLKALDQTFLKSSILGSGIYVGFHSPAVREFMLGILRTDEHALLRLIETASTFDQLDSLATATSIQIDVMEDAIKIAASESEPLPLEGLRSAFISAVTRHIPLPDPNHATSTRQQEALAKLVRLPAYLHPDRAWWEGHLKEVSRAWSTGNGSVERAQPILEFARGYGADFDALGHLAASVVDLIKNSSYMADTDWSAATAIYQSVLQRPVPEALISRFQEYVSSEIEFQGLNIGNLVELRAVAEQIGSREALNAIEDHERRIAAYEESQEHENYIGRHRSAGWDDSSTLENLFDRFS